MDFSGLVFRYRANRSLSGIERAQQLLQRRRLRTVPRYQLCVIKMNSTYLESVDKWFEWKGALSGISICIFLIFFGGFGLVALEGVLDAFDDQPDLITPGALLANALGFGVVACLIGYGAIWMLRKECFSFTHFPIRFNRKTRMVHVFRPDGTVLSVPWNEIFFTVAENPAWREAEIQGHVLAADRKTVLETFVLSYVGTSQSHLGNSAAGSPAENDYVRAHWEFIRRYMEDGPQSVIDGVDFCMAVDRQRERFSNGVERVFANIAGGPWLIYWLMAPFCFAVSLLRFLAMQTSKIPVWPEEVEASCHIEPGDPYAIEGDAKGNRVSVFPKASQDVAT